MINCKQKEIIVGVLGKQYSPKIIEHLNKKKIFNSNGVPYSNPSIQKIVSGTQKNNIVELEIGKLLVKVKKKEQTKNNLYK
ncbi:hypothetical protein KHA90_04055 [Flavobacterium psychroterrae]|jgi:hypothetical protein|uniref:Uncharacterized protein n=1 Tax=Flavobacterium psychroterrae TaxID=2133767 RepID=A0ABS5P7E2_9FLAO|nr:hypothetical protein [Flavobacterium psychroterrae]MBS7230189.1 hypothetical protein [Flavobacterium psychroterrae]